MQNEGIINDRHMLDTINMEHTPLMKIFVDTIELTAQNISEAINLNNV